ncbi:hypothetical protein BDN72DRAFT_844239 [Pluteus cervinus]|uniref:Uncharacterized protein n=1 Tax=Pluteus cervinus TaxID=181527 RepID=A0ACD3ALM6_9AGAR|nr:hypothetical protein BDN72DRAFT_844239 [Pluteus cervinus]
MRLSLPIALPPEILHFILDEYVPVYDAERIEVTRTRKTKIPKNWAPYASQLQFFAQLRFVCRSWYNFITPLLYSTFTLPTHPHEDLERFSKGLSYHPDLIDHLVLRGHLGDGAMQHAAELLAACLSQCTHLRTLEILDAHRIFRGSSKSKSMAIFRSLPPTVSLNRLIFRFPRRNGLRIYPISITLVGLGPLVQTLKTLEIHDPYGKDNDAILNLPSTFPNLQRFVVRGAGLDVNLPKLVSRICFNGPPTQAMLDATFGPLRYERAIPLRDLTLHWNGTCRATDTILHLLETNDLGQNLTSLCIYSSHPSEHQGATDEVLALAGKIIAACPCLETFIYFIMCPDTIFTVLPRTLKTLGLPLVHDTYYEYLNNYMPKPLTPSHHKPLIDWLKRTDRKGFKQLLLQTSPRDSHRLEGVKRACQAANIELILSGGLTTVQTFEWMQ